MVEQEVLQDQHQEQVVQTLVVAEVVEVTIMEMAVQVVQESLLLDIDFNS
jgi:hypothetical protein